MNNILKQQTTDLKVIRIICAIIFLAFTFSYLFFYQAPVLAVEQHVLSGGQAHYSRTLGAIIITAVFFFIHIIIYSAVHLPLKFHALTYFPSLLLLIILPSRSSISAWQWTLATIILILYVGVIISFRGIKTAEKASLPKRLFQNVLAMAIMIFIVGAISRGNSLYHYRAQAEQYLIKGDYERAAQVGTLYQKSDSSLTMIRIYALSRTGKLGEKLFEHPIVSSSKVLLPDGKNIRFLMYPEQKLYQYLGERTKGSFKTMEYFNFLETLGKARQAVGDYVLTGYLLDKDLDKFVKDITKYYKINDRLPKHYREALTLYTHLRSNPALVFHSAVMDTDFKDYQNLQQKYANHTLRKAALLSTYGNTYWYFYQYAQ